MGSNTEIYQVEEAKEAEEKKKRSGNGLEMASYCVCSSSKISILESVPPLLRWGKQTRPARRLAVPLLQDYPTKRRVALWNLLVAEGHGRPSSLGNLGREDGRAVSMMPSPDRPSDTFL